MWGAVVGDIAGSRFEGSRGGPKDFELFHHLCAYTDDTVCTAAVADIVLNDRKPDFSLQRWCRRHPGRGYGGFFREWIEAAVPTSYGSFGNGAAMRVSPVALLYCAHSGEPDHRFRGNPITRSGQPDHWSERSDAGVGL